MAYISLYRKYRPQTFEDVVGQEHVTTTLRNSIIEGRIASGYLFTGTRGTAKTTCARILAKALNCIGPDGTRDTPNPEPCGICGPCRGIASSSFVDVLEMDAASHGKVDDVRDLVASIKFPPMEGRYKVYIIDEAHQLSRDAMDAFLKTLEEPPAGVVFVLATTELEKLPITIASRCQVYEFKRGSVAQISARVADVLQAEGIGADAAAVTLIARAADGSYRDSLSLLEQVLAYQREHVTAQDVTVVLGTIDDDLLSQVVDLIADSDAAGAFGLVGSILESGKDVRQFLKSLAERFRNMLFVGVGARPAAPGEMDDSAQMRAQAARFAPATLLQALETLTAAEQETKRSNQHRLLLEMALLRLMRLPSEAAPPSAPTYAAPPPQAVAAPPSSNGNGVKAAPVPVVTVDAGRAGEEPLPARSSPPSPKGRGDESVDDVPSRRSVVPAAEALRAGAEGAPLAVEQLHPAGWVSIPPPSTVMEAEGILPAIPYDMPPPLDEDELPDEDEDLSVGLLLPGDDELDSLPLDDEEEMPRDDIPGDNMPSMVVISSEQHEQADDLMRVQQVAAELPAPVLFKAAPAADAPPELLRLQKSWQEVVNRMSIRPATAAFLREGEPISLTGNTILVKFPNVASVDRLEGNDRGKQLLEEAVNKTLGVDVGTYRVKATLTGVAPPARAPQAKVAQGLAPPVREATPLAPEKPGAFVDEVIAVFGGQLLDDDLKG